MTVSLEAFHDRRDVIVRRAMRHGARGTATIFTGPVMVIDVLAACFEHIDVIVVNEQ